MTARPRTVWIVLFGAIATLMACEEEFSGPGAYIASVAVPTGGSAGAVVLQIEGRGIESFGDLGTTRVFAGETDASGRLRRLVLIGTGDRLAFEIRVDDMSRRAPRALVVSAVDTDNEALGVAGFGVTVVPGH